ncbi:MAG: PIN domain-containing protein [Candidatus Methanoperedens sp.]|nr:PIN domain-containing protein [Candidatus Methanoperedens sp.]
MNLNELPPDSEVFIDSNIFTYHLLGYKRYRESVRDFLIKIESGVYKGFINEIVISEVVHNVLRVKICEKYNILPIDFARFIKSNPQTISEVNLDKAIDILSMANLQLIQEIEINMVKDHISKYNLLSADAIHTVSCNIQDIQHIATNDSDFERAIFLNVWTP